jgi:riboflavin synthase
MGIEMFTGIIEAIGTVDSVRTSGNAMRLAVNAENALEGTKIGDSIAVNGACLTVVSLQGFRFEADVSPETVSRTTFSRCRIGQRVNLERALRLSDRLDGHIVSGHVDGMGAIDHRENRGNAIVVTVGIPEPLSRYMIEKGSVAIDGVSLTVNALLPGQVQVSLIPHTAHMTTIGFKRVGDPVNIECDMIGKYIERLLNGAPRRPHVVASRIDRAFLEKTGFL